MQTESSELKRRCNNFCQRKLSPCGDARSFARENRHPVCHGLRNLYLSQYRMSINSKMQIAPKLFAIDGLESL